jgi:hypothetical protein
MFIKYLTSTSLYQVISIRIPSKWYPESEGNEGGMWWMARVKTSKKMIEKRRKFEQKTARKEEKKIVRNLKNMCMWEKKIWSGQ